MMKKVFVGAVALFVTIGAVSAQTTQFGIKGGYNNSKIITDKSGTTSKSVSGFNTGVVADIGITDMFSVRTGLDLQSKGAELMDNKITGKITANPLFLEIPVNLNVNFPLSNNVDMYAGAGPYVAFGVGGKLKSTGALFGYAKDYSESIKWGNDNNADLKKVDAGLNVGAGLKFNKRFGVHVQYGIGMVDLATDKSKVYFDKVKNRALGVSGIFYF